MDSAARIADVARPRIPLGDTLRDRAAAIAAIVHNGILTPLRGDRVADGETVFCRAS